MPDLADAQWERFVPLIPNPPRRPNGILWVLWGGARWKDMPKQYPPYQICHRRFQDWIDQGVFEWMAQDLASVLEEQGQLELAECFIDGSFVRNPKRAAMLGVVPTATDRR